MKNLIFELAKVDRRAALIFNREIKLRIKRGELEFWCSTHISLRHLNLRKKNVLGLIDSFCRSDTRQGHSYWRGVYSLIYTKGR